VIAAVKGAVRVRGVTCPLETMGSEYTDRVWHRQEPV